MADETVVAEADSTPPAAQTDANGGGKQPEQQGAEEKTMTLTQAQFDAMVNERIDRAASKATDKANKEKADADAKALEEQGKYEDLYKAELAKREAAETAKAALEKAGWQKDAAAKHKLPVAWADRLKGDTAEAIDADAAELAKTLPKPGAPGINATEGDKPPANQKTDANRKDFERSVRRM